MEQLTVMRTEKKYEISYYMATKMRNILSSTIKNDENNSENGYLVRTLYFDTVFDSDYWDKQNGYENRRKVRLRTYNTKSETLKLELKEKKGENQIKRSLLITRDIAKRLIDGDYSCLLEVNTDFAEELYYIMQTNLYKPKCIVEYNRHAYTVKENNIRITIDSNIRGTESNMDMFLEELPLYSISSQIILEVKYNNFLLSYIKDIIDMANKTELSASKYCSARCISYLFDCAL